VQDDELSTQISRLARRLAVLDDRVRTGRDRQPAVPPPGRTDDADSHAHALIAQLTVLVERLQDELDRRPADPAGPHLCRLPSEWPRTDFSGAAAAMGFDASHARVRPEAGGHGVHFSRSDDHAVAAIIDMFDDARSQGRASIVVATALHRRWIEADLHQRCIAFEGDVCRFLDAETTLSSLLVDGELDRERFRSIIGELLADACSRNPAGVAVYGEMVGILWSQGQRAAALRLEELWNELQQELPFSLLCGYLVDVKPDSTDLDRIRDVHTYVG
jgi:hypothetical protein